MRVRRGNYGGRNFKQLYLSLSRTPQPAPPAITKSQQDSRRIGTKRPWKATRRHYQQPPDGPLDPEEAEMDVVGRVSSLPAAADS